MARRVGLAVLVATAASLFLAMPSAAAGGCHGEPSGEFVDGNEVTIAECAFTPQVLHIDPGAEVTFTNKDHIPHTATGADWGTEWLERGDSATVTFDEAGTFAYYCELHPNMTGTIIVGDGEAAAAAPASDDGTLASSMSDESGEGVSVLAVGIAVLSGLFGFAFGRLTTRLAPAAIASRH